MAAGAAPGPELCPHCHRPFKRLRAHLPHCKAAPRPPPLPATSPRPSPATGTVPGPTPTPGPAAPREDLRGAREPAVQDVARSLDLHPEEVEEIPKKLQKGVKVVIEKHRARVVREKEPGGSAGAAGRAEGGTEPGPAPRKKTAPKSKRKETRSQGAVGNGTASSKGEKNTLKATKVLQDSSESRNSLGELIQQEKRDKSTAGEEQVHLEVGVGSKAPVSALHPKNLHLSLTKAFRGQWTSKNEPSRLQGLRDSGEQMDRAHPEPIVSLGGAPELALLHSPKTQPTCSSRASGSSSRATATGLEWFPDLYPDREGLRIFPGMHSFQKDVRIAAETPMGGFSQPQQGPLSERPLMEVRLGELHTWISTCSFSPQGLFGALQKAWSSYCAKYIHVRQGGPAGISMLLAGYCLLSYGWNYQHFKRHRWRKYH